MGRGSVPNPGRPGPQVIHQLKVRAPPPQAPPSAPQGPQPGPVTPKSPSASPAPCEGPVRKKTQAGGWKSSNLSLLSHHGRCDSLPAPADGLPGKHPLDLPGWRLLGPPAPSQTREDCRSSVPAPARLPPRELPDPPASSTPTRPRCL